MGVPTGLRRSYESVERWLDDHLLGRWLVFTLIPGGVYAALEVAVSDGSPSRAVILGAAFGATFATIHILVSRWRGR